MDNMRILTIDQGNSSAKAVVWFGDLPEKELRLFSLSIEELLPLLETGEIDGCIYCSVGHTDAKFLETLRRLVDGRMMLLTHSTPLPVDVKYGSRTTLGNDRVAAALGAGRLFPGESLLVVDAGTALTVDVTDRNGTFLGGNISPGARMRFESLHNYTDRLPLVEAAGEVMPFGADTVSAIRSGVIMGMVSEIADAYKRAGELYGTSRIVITGNDSGLFVNTLRERGCTLSEDHNLVGRGLLSAYLYNMNLDKPTE